jgi:hypothetical protein
MTPTPRTKEHHHNDAEDVVKKGKAQQLLPLTVNIEMSSAFFASGHDGGGVDGPRQAADVESASERAPRASADDDHDDEGTADNARPDDMRPLDEMTYTDNYPKDDRTTEGRSNGFERKEQQQQQRQNSNGNGNSNGNSGIVSDRILRQVRDHHARARRERQCSVRRIFAVLLGILPVCLFAFEVMIPERCNYLCPLDDGDGDAGDHGGQRHHHRRNVVVELSTYFVFAAVCGGFGATLYSAEFWNYSLARFVGGSTAAVGSLFTVWMIFRNLPTDLDRRLSPLFVVVGVLGTMPGLVVYFLLKILSDECCCCTPSTSSSAYYDSDQHPRHGVEDEFVALTATTMG